MLDIEEREERTFVNVRRVCLSALLAPGLLLVVAAR